MRGTRLFLAVILAGIASASPAMAHHVAWLDFSQFNLSDFPSVNGNTPPTAADVAAVQALIVANMVEDFAPFDVHFTTFQPANGRHSRVRFIPGAVGVTLLGATQPGSCRAGGTCTGWGSWDDVAVSACEVYAQSFAGRAAFQGANATTARIANGLSNVGSHELGHLFDLRHRYAADDAITLGCTDATCPALTGDQNVAWHIMALGNQWNGIMTSSINATRDLFFSIHASRRVLHAAVQARNHWNLLGNLNAGAGRSDLAYGRVQSPTTTAWYARLSSGAAFGGYTTWRNDAGDAGDIFLLGDVDGDSRADLVYGRIVSATQVRWYVRLSDGSSFGDVSVWRCDAGDAGDIFRLADVDGDGRADLVYARPLRPTTLRWYVRLSTGTSFGDYSTWRSDAGAEGDVFFLGDVDADGRADLVYARTLSAMEVRWYVRRSSGRGFRDVETWRRDAGDRGDLFYLGDIGGDGDADLLYGRTLSDTQVKWYGRFSTGNAFDDFDVWRNDAGDAGDLFRIGDGDGDGRRDLFYARPIGMTSLIAAPDLTKIRWYGRLSQGGSFGDFTTWRSDAGDEGDIFP